MTKHAEVVVKTYAVHLQSILINRPQQNNEPKDSTGNNIFFLFSVSYKESDKHVTKYVCSLFSSD